MKRLSIALLLLLGAASAFAQERKPAVLEVTPPEQKRVQWDIGMVQIHTGAANLRVAYLPLLAPLPSTDFRPVREVPNALLLTGTELPLRPSHGR